MRIVFMGTPVFAVPALEKLAADPAYELLGVFTRPDLPSGRGYSVQISSVKKRALELNLPLFQPKKLMMQYDHLKTLHLDAIIVVAFGEFLDKKILELPRLGCINLHASLLPRWRGASPIQRAILAGDDFTGVSAIYLTEELDAGSILFQKKTPIKKTDTFQTLSSRLSQMGADLLLETLKALETQCVSSYPQDISQVTYAGKLTKEMQWLDPRCTAKELDQKIRAFDPWPGTSVWIGRRLKIKKANLLEEVQFPVGQILTQENRVFLGTAKGSLELLELQWEGRTTIQALEFVHGFQGKEKLPLSLSIPPMAEER